jgi:hypothetical protein
VQTFDQRVDVLEVYRPVNLSQQVVLGYDHIRTEHFYCLTLFFFPLQHFHHLMLLYQKTLGWGPSFDGLTGPA